MIKPTERNFFYNFSPDPDIYSTHYSQFANLVDLARVKDYFHVLINITKKQKNKISAKDAKKLYIKALSSKNRVINASQKNNDQNSLTENEIIQLNILAAETIDAEIEVEQKPLFKRVANTKKILFPYRKIYLKIKNQLN